MRLLRNDRTQSARGSRRLRTSACGASICVLVLLFGGIPVGLAQTAPGKTVLVLYDGGREFASIQMMDRNIELALKEALSSRVTIFREFMDLTRIRSADYEQTLRAFYRAKYSNNRPDVIIAVRGRALDFLLKPGDELFPGVPVVSSAMDMRQVKERTLPSNVTGRTLQVRYWPTIALAVAMQPEIEQMIIVSGASPNDRALESLVRDELAQHAHHLKIMYLAGLSIDELTRQVANLPHHTAILFVCFAQDRNGQSFLPNEVLTRIAHAANAPTYIASDDVVDCEVVGGDVISFAAMGRDTGMIALRLLDGENPSSIPFTEYSSRVKLIDARQLKRWGISESRAPVGSMILNRVPSVWEEYRWWIVGAISLLGLQSALISMLLFHRKHRRLAEHGLVVSEANGRAAVLKSGTGWPATCMTHWHRGSLASSCNWRRRDTRLLMVLQET
jgi:ABC-type uncharacterized transport system substrate-binding protein